MGDGPLEHSNFSLAGSTDLSRLGSRDGIAKTPCFYWKSCRRFAAVEKQGKSVCRECAERLKGMPYPMRPPTREPLYLTGWELARDLDMIELRRVPASSEPSS